MSVLVAGCVALAGCGAGASPSDSGAAPNGSATTGPAAGSGPSNPASPTPPESPALAGWSCDSIKNAPLGSQAVPYTDATSPVRFHNGAWSDEEGNMVQIKMCAVGDIDGNGPDDALAAVMMKPVLGNGEFWTLALWKDTGGTATFVTLTDLGDRNPVESVDLHGTSATVVWDTRGASDPMAVLTIRRTSTYTLVGGVLHEASHTDAAYTNS
jgi:hypothetical protein